MSNLDSQLLSASKVVLLLSGNVSPKIAEEVKTKTKGNVLVLEHGKSLADLESASVDVVISYTSDPATHTSDLLATIISKLKPSGGLALYEPLQGRNFSASEDLASRLLLSGFIDTKVASSGDNAEIYSLKPEWEVGSSQKVGIKKTGNGNPTAGAWAVPPTQDTELIDEDSLLNEGDRYAKPATTRDDCEVGKTGKKACKDCTCGRAEEEANGVPKKKITLEMLENPGTTSSCGSCGLGDAFRCGGCPYRGLPAFKVGEKITIPDSFLDDDI